MQKTFSVADGVQKAVTKFARPNEKGELTVEVSLISTVIGVSNNDVVQSVKKLETFGAPMHLHEDRRIVLTR